MLAVDMPHVEAAYENQGDNEIMPEPHITPPLTRPRGPVQLSVANSQLKIAIMPITVKVIANAKTNG